VKPSAPRWYVVLIGIGVLAALAIGITGSRALLLSGTPEEGSSRAMFLAFAISFASIAVLVLVLTQALAAYNRHRNRHIAALRPGAEVFTSTRVDGFVEGLAGLPVGGRGVAAAFGTSIGSQGIELWRNGELTTPAFALPWHEVAAIAPGDAVIRNPRGQTVSAPALLVTRSGGQVLPLTVARARSGYPESPEAVAALSARLQPWVSRHR
jgi:hypothetical protein